MTWGSEVGVESWLCGEAWLHEDRLAQGFLQVTQGRLQETQGLLPKARARWWRRRLPAPWQRARELHWRVGPPRPAPWRRLQPAARLRGREPGQRRAWPSDRIPGVVRCRRRRSPVPGRSHRWWRRLRCLWGWAERKLWWRSTAGAGARGAGGCAAEGLRAEVKLRVAGAGACAGQGPARGGEGLKGPNG